MWSHEHTAETEAAPEAIWSLWSDVSSWSRWDDDIQWASLEGAFTEGSRGRLKPQGVPATAFTLASVVPGRSYTVEQRMPLARLRFHHQLENPDGGPTRFTHRVTIDGPLAGIYAALFGRRMKRNFSKIMRHLAEEAAAADSGANSP
jgi:hypothetical protein